MNLRLICKGFVISRFANPLLDVLRAGYPVITITGPRQSGKTTLARVFWLTYGAINGTINAYGTNRKNSGDDAPGTGKCKFQ